MRERDHLKDPDIDWKIILKWVFRTRGGGMEWIYVVKNKKSWRTVVNMGFIKCGEFLD